MPKVPKISLYIFAVTSCCFQKSMRYEIDFLPVKKPKNVLQIDSINLGVPGQTCPKYPKQQFFNIFAISQGKCKG